MGWSPRDAVDPNAHLARKLALGVITILVLRTRALPLATLLAAALPQLLVFRGGGGRAVVD